MPLRRADHSGIDRHGDQLQVVLSPNRTAVLCNSDRSTAWLEAEASTIGDCGQADSL